MAEARPSFFDFDVTKMMTDFRFRPFDVEALMACQRRNIEAFSQANQLAVEGVQAVARRQIEIARQALEDVSVLFRELTQPTSTEERIAKNTEYAKQMLEKSVTAARSPSSQPRPAPRRPTSCASARAKASTSCATWQNSTPLADPPPAIPSKAAPASGRPFAWVHRDLSYRGR